MARRPNYSFEKNARAKAKAAKREAKRLQKAASREDKKQEDTDAPNQPVEDASPAGEEASES